MGDVPVTTLDAGLRTSLLDRLRVGTLALDMLIVSGVALMLGLIRLGAPALWYDEAYTVRQIERSYVEQIEGYQPFYYWIQKPWTSVAGVSEWALRFPSVVGAMVACALLVVLARKLFDRRIALLRASSLQRARSLSSGRSRRGSIHGSSSCAWLRRSSYFALSRRARARLGSSTDSLRRPCS